MSATTSASSKAGSPGKAEPGASPSKSPGRIKEPVGLVCYICGGKFGSASLKIHIP